MDVKPGYRKTDVGVIPEEWNIETIAHYCDYADYRGKTPPKTQSGTFLITARNVRKGFIDYHVSQEYVATELYEQIMRRGKPRIGDVLITTEAPLGNVAQVDWEDVALAQRIIKYRPKSENLCSTYLKYYLLGDRFQQILNAHGSGSTAKGIKGRVLHQLPVVTPPPAEQRAIAAALGDIDALLKALDTLLAKKRDLILAAMQQLLTGQTRLAGFYGEWKAKRLGDIAPLQRGFDLPNRMLTAGPFPVVYSNGILHHHSAFQVKGPGVVTGRSGTIGKVTYVDCDFWPHNTSLWVTNFRDNSPRFIFYLYSSLGLERFSSGSGVPTLNRNDVHYFEIPTPPTLEEQTAIAAVLTDMDAELSALEHRLAKTRDLKQAIMQELLTGKTRLVSSKASHA